MVSDGWVYFQTCQSCQTVVALACLKIVLWHMWQGWQNVAIGSAFSRITDINEGLMIFLAALACLKIDPANCQSIISCDICGRNGNTFLLRLAFLWLFKVLKTPVAALACLKIDLPSDTAIFSQYRLVASVAGMTAHFYCFFLSKNFSKSWRHLWLLWHAWKCTHPSDTASVTTDQWHLWKEWQYIYIASIFPKIALSPEDTCGSPGMLENRPTHQILQLSVVQSVETCGICGRCDNTFLVLLSFRNGWKHSWQPWHA